MKTIKNLLILFAVSALILSCGNTAKKVEDKLNEAVEEMDKAIDEAADELSIEMEEVDMNDMGMPIVLEVPKGTEISEGLLHSTEGDFQYYDYKLTFDKYVINVTMDPEGIFESMEEMVEDAKEVYLDEEAEVVEEFEGGFIYKNMYDDEEDYSFYYVKEKDGMAIEFTTGLTFDFYSLEDIKRLLDIAKNAE
ncbi:MAG TPA: hypothetical protein P5509_06990 [Bacteroidales bacterium]|nr:hypothetical protein [Bacteroidales bacterium]